MKHDFIDKYSHLDSPVHRIDPVVKIITAIAAILIIVTEPVTSGLLHFVLYGGVIMAAVSISRIPPAYLMKRFIIIAPFITLISLFYPISVMLGADNPAIQREQAFIAATAVFAKATLAVVILILLSSTDRFHILLMAMRRLRIPSIVTTISALLYRYIFLLADESLKTTRARESRTPGRLFGNRFKIYGNQVAVIFLRSWERSQIIYKSMLSRGFTGEYPDTGDYHLRIAGVILPFLFVVLLLSVRVFM